MHVVDDAFNASDLPRGGIATIGNFDGVHRGQRAILETVVRRAEELGVPPLVVTFDPHPLSVLAPERAPLPLTTRAQKEDLLSALGIEWVLNIRFSADFARIPARAFVRDFLHGKLGLREIYVGETFVFGHQREGDLSLLQSLGEELGFRAAGVREVAASGERISSSRIRRALLDGDVVAAGEMLGRPYAIAGSIVRGDRMGKRLGWPTINLVSEHRLIPGDGVYCTRVYFPSYPSTFDCVTNIGTRPTVYENYNRVVESHILEFKADVYGKRVELSFYKRLREERIFPNVMELSAQIGRDVEATREYFSRRRAEGLEQESTLGG